MNIVKILLILRKINIVKILKNNFVMKKILKQIEKIFCNEYCINIIDFEKKGLVILDQLQL